MRRAINLNDVNVPNSTFYNLFEWAVANDARLVLVINRSAKTGVPSSALDVQGDVKYGIQPNDDFIERAARSRCMLRVYPTPHRVVHTYARRHLRRRRFTRILSSWRRMHASPRQWPTSPASCSWRTCRAAQARCTHRPHEIMKAMQKEKDNENTKRMVKG